MIFFLGFFFSIRPTDPISGNAFDGKRKKKKKGGGDGLTEIKAAKEQGQRDYFSASEPDKLYVNGNLIQIS